MQGHGDVCERAGYNYLRGLPTYADYRNAQAITTYAVYNYALRIDNLPHFFCASALVDSCTVDYWPIGSKLGCPNRVLGK
jgi:hypothetical protein